ncbi:MAG TPA: tetratricopeptide repeat protein [Candidatus Binatia bacterium]|nr:tetratricopeptide repeat protein [Candidatus Binatia bacterium]
MRCADHGRTAALLGALLGAMVLAGCAPDPPRPAPRKPVARTAPKPASGKPAAKAPATAAKAGARKTSAPADSSTKTATGSTPAPAAPAKSPAATAPPPGQTPADAPPPPPQAVVARTPQERYAQALDAVKTSQWQAAETALQASVRDYPQQSGPRTNLGIVYARTNRKPQALAEFTRAVSLNPRNAVAFNWIGVLARESGDLPRAEQAYQRALSADPAYAPAQLNLAILYDEYLKRPADALAAYRRYQTLAGKTDPRAAVWIAQLESRGKPQGASP